MKTLGRWKNEDPRGLIRRYIWRNFVHKFQNILYWSKHPKRQRNRCSRAQTTLTCVRRMHLDAWHLKLQTHAPDTRFYVPVACSLRAKVFFVTFCWKKTRYFNPTSGENSPYKYRSPHSRFHIQNEAVQKEGKH